MKKPMKFQDIHGHYMNYKDTYGPFYFGRLGIDPDWIKAISKLKKLKIPIVEIVDFICKKTGKNDIKEFLNFFFLSRNEQWKFYKENGIHTLEVFPDSELSTVFKSDFINPVSFKHTDFTKSESKFRGIKCYPSLGYLPEMTEKYTHLMIHCSPGGINTDDFCSQDNNPAYWTPRLESNFKEKYCFAHFGGEKNFCDYFVDNKNNWTKDIVDFMQIYPGKVYADTAYFIPNSPRKRKALKNAIESDISPFILFGGDMPLILSEPDISTYDDYINMYFDCLSYNSMSKLGIDNINKFKEIPE